MMSSLCLNAIRLENKTINYSFSLGEKKKNKRMFYTIRMFHVWIFLKLWFGDQVDLYSIETSYFTEVVYLINLTTAQILNETANT